MATAELDQIRDKYRAKIATALQEDEDPLATYETFVKWTVENYPDKLIARSGLLELLEETTRQFKDDEAYKGDLRYLKLWMLYANNVEHPPTVFSFLLKNNIGSVYAQLYEEYAMALLAIGRYAKPASFTSCMYLICSLGMQTQRKFSKLASGDEHDQLKG